MTDSHSCSDRKHYVAANISELPSDIQKKISQSKLSPEDIENGWEVRLDHK